MNITIRFEDYEYQTATILEVSVQFDEVCDQMESLIIDQFKSDCVLCTSEQLLTIAARFPRLHTVMC